MMIRILSFSFLILAGLQSAFAEADIKHGEQLSQTCMGCHGAPGFRNAHPVYHVPLLGGQHADYIVTALKAYASKERSHPTMQAQASNLSEQDMADIAAYFASLQDNQPGNIHGNKEHAKKGEELAAQCVACHGADGKSPTSAYPILAGQYEDYLIQVLKDYRSGERNNAIMAGFAAPLSIHQIEELAAWFANQKGGLSAPDIKIKK